ncbi:MAG TPA: ATP-binding cassette domain-containing protein [Fimbriimonadaceae bacterium]|jgi:sodium transport system ATP-binding protein
MVRTHNIAKIFTDPKRGEIKAVDGVTFEARPGQILGLLGSNGAGKTTLLRMLSTVLTPTSGTADVAGFDVVRDSQKVRASLGFMSTSTALYGRSTAREMIEYFAQLFGLSGARLKERTQFVIDKLEIAEFENQLCDKLSTGQKQRVSIARTIVHDPPVLFFDEPTTGLDIIVSQSVMQFVEECRDQGKTVIYCTHIMSEVERLCDHVVVIHDGQIRGEGTVDQLKAQTNETSLERAFLSLAGVLSTTPIFT